MSTNLFTPESRRERLLHAIATGDQSELDNFTPVSRIEKLLFYIATHTVKDTGIGEPFDESKSYAKGELVIYNGMVYQFTADKSAGAWDASKVVEVPLGEVIERLGERIGEVEASGVFMTEVE